MPVLPLSRISGVFLVFCVRRGRVGIIGSRTRRTSCPCSRVSRSEHLLVTLGSCRRHALFPTLRNAWGCWWWRYTFYKESIKLEWILLVQEKPAHCGRKPDVCRPREIHVSCISFCVSWREETGMSPFPPFPTPRRQCCRFFQILHECSKV